MSKVRQQRKNTNRVNTGLELKSFGPITDNQIKTFRYYEDDENLVLHGSAGTGKTFCGLYLALKELLSGNSNCRKIVIVRTAQPTKQIGHLPGSADQKLAVYEAPYKSICSQIFGRADAYEVLKHRGLIEFMGTSFIGGITLDDSIIIIDEVQNMSWPECYHIITRMGNHSRLIVCGDTKQDVLTNERYKEESGFGRMMKVFSKMNNIKDVKFGIEDVVRSGFVRDFIIADESV